MHQIQIVLATALLGFQFCSSLAASSTQQISLTVSDGKEKLVGTLYLPEHAQGSVPLVIVVPEWWGKNEYSDGRASKIANELGAIALSVDLYGGAKNAANPQEATEMSGPFYKDPMLGVRRLNALLAEASNTLKGSKIQIDSAKIFAIGYCFGGTQVLNLARSGQMPAGDDLVGVVSFHGGLASSLKAEKQIQPKLLVLQGEEDQMVKPEDVATFKKEMEANKADLHFVAYPGAMHAFTNPKATALGKKFGIPVAYNESADKKSWLEFRDFYKKLTAH